MNGPQCFEGREIRGFCAGMGPRVPCHSNSGPKAAIASKQSDCESSSPRQSALPQRPQGGFGGLWGNLLTGLSGRGLSATCGVLVAHA